MWANDEGEHFLFFQNNFQDFKAEVVCVVGVDLLMRELR